MPGPWGFDPMQFEGSLAVQRRTGGEVSRISLPAPAGDIFSEIRLADLGRFLEHPAREFIRTRLGFGIPPPGEIPDDTVPTDLGPLGEWQVTDRFLAGLLHGHPIESLEAHERAGDSVPPGYLGRGGLDKARKRAVDLWTAARRVGYEPERHEQFTGAVRLGNGTIEGLVTADAGASRVDMVTPSRLKGKQRLRVFVQMLFLSALDPRRPWHGLLIGRHLYGDKLWSVTIGPLRGDHERRKQEADRLLSGLVDLYVEGLNTPVPLPCETAFHLAEEDRRRSGERPQAGREDVGDRQVLSRGEGPGQPVPVPGPTHHVRAPAEFLPGSRKGVVGSDPSPAAGEGRMTTVGPYDPYAPIADGRTVIEASAGTGKTFTIAAVVTRLVAEEGLPLERILVVTFTRAATAELKDRVRRRMVNTLSALHRSQGGGQADGHMRVLLDANPDQQGMYSDRLEEALTHFDRAQIFTIHGFALRLLQKLGFRSRLSGDMGAPRDRRTAPAARRQ